MIRPLSSALVATSKYGDNGCDIRLLISDRAWMEGAVDCRMRELRFDCAETQ